MKILFYTLGFPPYRSGGLTKYAYDLSNGLLRYGQEIYMLWPGRINSFKKFGVYTKKVAETGIYSCEIINPLPVPLDEGVREIPLFMNSCKLDVCINFFETIKPEVFHIHTLMGLHKEWIIAAKKLGIKVIYTTHDYYGLCPKVTLYRKGQICSSIDGCSECTKCNETALSLNKIMILQSPLYRNFKDLFIVKWLRKIHRNNYFAEIDNNQTQLEMTSDDRKEEYKAIQEYYKWILESVDFIHYNSTITKSVFEKCIQSKKSKIISISNESVRDMRVIKNYDSHSDLRMTFLGPLKSYKGFQFIINVLDELWNQGHTCFELYIYTGISIKRPYIKYEKSSYKAEDLGAIFSTTDILLVPSQWYETFGLTTIEALSYAVPVIVSDTVGAKDLVKNNYGWILKRNEDDWILLIKEILYNRNLLKDKNEVICNSDDLGKHLNYENHLLEMLGVYEERV